MGKNIINPFSDEFDKSDVINKEHDNSGLIDKNSENYECYLAEILGKAEESLDLDSIENYDEGVINQKKFKSLSDDPSIKRIDTIDDDLRKELSFRNYNTREEEESMTDQEILRQNFKDFLILRNISGELSGISHTNKIPEDKIRDTNKSIVIEDDPNISETDEKKHSSSVVLYRNELEEIEYIEVMCSCGQKTVIEFDYENSGYSLRPNAFIKEDSDMDSNIHAVDVKNIHSKAIEYERKSDEIKEVIENDIYEQNDNFLNTLDLPDISDLTDKDDDDNQLEAGI